MGSLKPVDLTFGRSWALGGVIPRGWELPMITVDLEKAIVVFYNAMMPHLYHYITVTEKDTGKTHTIKQYSGGPLWDNIPTSNEKKGGDTRWSTYRYQLEAFVMKCKGQEPPVFVSHEESINQMETIDQMYQVSGLGPRPSNHMAN